MPSFHFLIFWTLFFETLHALRQGLFYTMPGKHLIHWGTPLPTYSSHSFCFPPHPSNTQLKEKKKVFQSSRKSAGVFICFFEMKKKNKTIITANILEQRTERIFFRKKTVYKYSSMFQVTGLLSYLKSCWKSRLFHSYPEFAFCFLCFHLARCCLQGSPANLRNHLNITPQSWGWASVKAGYTPPEEWPNRI